MGAQAERNDHGYPALADVARVRRKLEISEEATRNLMRLVRREVRARYGQHHQIDDILASAYAGMWAAVVEVERTKACARTTAAVQGGLHAAADWLRSGENEGRRYTRRGVVLPRQLSLERLVEAGREVLGNGVESFVGALVERLACEEQVERWLAMDLLTPEEWEILRRTLVDGQAAIDAALSMQIAYDCFLDRRERAVRKLLEAAEG